MGLSRHCGPSYGAFHASLVQCLVHVSIPFSFWNFYAIAKDFLFVARQHMRCGTCFFFMLSCNDYWSDFSFLHRIRDDFEKEDAFHGLCAMVNPKPFT